MKNTYSFFDSTSRPILKIGLVAADLLGTTDLPGAAAPETQPRSVAPQPQAASLPVLVRDLPRDYRCEGVAWVVLAVSAVVLLALSLWL